MGLDITHNCWHGAYSAFMRWRQEICRASGLPPLNFMEGFYQAESGTEYQDPIYWARKGLMSEDAFEDIRRSLPIKWECLKPSALHTLLHHSDCDGEIEWEECGRIADALEELLPKLPTGESGGHIGNWRDKTATFIAGLRLAHKNQENVEFH
jgi:hypothetical protein